VIKGLSSVVKMSQRIGLFCILSFLFLNTLDAQEQRFPKPEFESGYVQPSPSTPEPRINALEYTDVLLLLIALSLASWLAIKKRSRTGMIALSITVLAYFGFYRNGCICSVGSLQNVVLSIANPEYSVTISTLLFFVLPLVFALFFGRVFCAGACPLGTIQDLVVIKPIALPLWLRKVLGLMAYLYLGLAVLYAATGTDFIICRFDPFVGLFRMGAPFHMLVVGIGLLLTGMFVARPYCRFLCPYGVLLNWMSRFSKRHLSITPNECIQCKLCEQSCPFDAINKPNLEIVKTKEDNPRAYLWYLVLIPVFMLMVGYSASTLHIPLSRSNFDVHLAELLIQHPEVMNNPTDVDVQAFMASGKSLNELVSEAEVIRRQFYIGTLILGAWFGLVIALTLLRLRTHRTNTIYQPDKGDCVSCGRCFKYCPVKVN
jgi:ferredoxin